MNDIQIVGAGGIGQWLAPSLLYSSPEDLITLWDGDVWEHKNRLRSHVPDDDLGLNKALTTAVRLTGMIQPRAEYFIASKFRKQGLLPVFISCADNHRARMECLIAADANEGVAFIACNEEWSSQALVYFPAWFGTQLDPRIRYPDMMIITDNDPIAREAGCAEAINTGTTQTVSANLSAASAVLHLVKLWLNPSLTFDTKLMYYPMELLRNKTGVEAIYTTDHIKPHETPPVVPQETPLPAPPQPTPQTTGPTQTQNQEITTAA